MKANVSSSRPLHAGHHPSRKQVSLGLFLRLHKYPSFDVVSFVSTRQRWFAFARLLDTYLV